MRCLAFKMQPGARVAAAGHSENNSIILDADAKNFLYKGGKIISRPMRKEKMLGSALMHNCTDKNTLI